jgi:DNA modification methylase
MSEVNLKQGDCTEILKTIKEDSIDLTVTSPPYDNLRSYNGNNKLWNENIWQGVIKELYNVTKKGGVVVWVVGDATIKGSETGTSFKQALYAKECGFNLHDMMIYAKNNPIPLTHNRYDQQFEYMFVFSKGKPKTFNPIMQHCKCYGKLNSYKRHKQDENGYSMRNRNENIYIKKEKYLYNLWFFNTGTTDKVKHNAPFPEKLANDHIITWSNEGDTVLDPFMGSGTTGKMSLLNNRNFTGIELDHEYFEEAKKRIMKVKKNKKKLF